MSSPYLLQKRNEKTENTQRLMQATSIHVQVFHSTTASVCLFKPTNTATNHFKTSNTMTQQAQNSINLYRGGNPSTIQQLLRIQKQSVVDELMQHFGASSISDLALKLSFG